MAALAARYADYDAAVSEIVFSALQRGGFSEMRPGNANSVIGSLPFVSSPTPMITMILCYLAIVAFGLSVIKLRGARPTQQSADPLWLRFFVQARDLHSTAHPLRCPAPKLSRARALARAGPEMPATPCTWLSCDWIGEDRPLN